MLCLKLNRVSTMLAGAFCYHKFGGIPNASKTQTALYASRCKIFIREPSNFWTHPILSGHFAVNKQFIRSRHYFYLPICNNHATSSTDIFALVLGHRKPLTFFRGHDNAPNWARLGVFSERRLAVPRWEALGRAFLKGENNTRRTVLGRGPMSASLRIKLKPNKEIIMSKSILTEADDETKNALASAQRTTGKEPNELICLCLRAFVARQATFQKHPTPPASQLSRVRQSRATRPLRRA